MVLPGLLLTAVLISVAVLWLHSLQKRLGLAPLYALLAILGALSPCLWLLHPGPEAAIAIFQTQSLVFFAAFLATVLPLLVLNGPLAARLGIFIALGATLLSALVLSFLPGVLNGPEGTRFTWDAAGMFRLIAMAAAWTGCLLFLTALWKCLDRREPGLPRWSKVLVALAGAMALDLLLFHLLLQGTLPASGKLGEEHLLGRILLLLLLTPLLSFYLGRREQGGGAGIPGAARDVPEAGQAVSHELDVCYQEVERVGRVEATVRESERLLAQIIDFLPDPTWVIDRNGKVLAWNRAIETMSGVPAGDMLGKGDYEYAIPFYGDRRPVLIDLAGNPDPRIESIYPYLERRGDTLVSRTFHSGLGPDGVHLWGTASLLRDDQGRPMGAIESVRDITEQQHVLEALKRSESRMASILDAGVFPLLIVDRENMGVLFANNRAQERFGQDAASGSMVLEAGLFEDPEELSRLWAGLAAKGEVRDWEMRLQNQGGGFFWAQLSAINMDYAGRPAVLISFNDITRRKELEQELARQALTDSLTGISNRRHFYGEGQKEILRARRYGRRVSALMLDLDLFKAVNDTHGHQAGDAVLQSLAETCRAILRKNDLFGRLGGEEFAVLLPETSLEGALQTAGRIRRDVEEMRVKGPWGEIGLTVSLGVAEADPGDSLEDVLRAADEALYRAKQKGRNRVEAA